MNKLKVYQNRFDSEYREKILKQLSFESENNLIETALNIEEEEIRDVKYNKVINIDFFGISSSIFFDKGGNYNELNQVTSEAFEKFLGKLEIINKKGIKVRIRLLFVYPYSDYAFNRIQAECDYNRSSIDEKEYIRNFDLVNELDDNTFIGSTYFQNQIDCLAKIQEILSKKILSVSDGPNTIKIRFTTFGSSICILRLNNEIYFDPYIFAKKKKNEKKLVVGFPLVLINQQTNSFEFKSLEDHFRYLWTIDTTMYSGDATYFDPKTYKGLDKIKVPSQINFDTKGNRIKTMMNTHGETTPTEDEIVEWKFQLDQKLKKTIQNFKKSPERETLFITCSWEEDEYGKSQPNRYASKLEEWLKKDFSSSINILLVKANVGTSLNHNVYENLNDSSLALVIMKKDFIHRKKGYCKPNIYHELGYLMKQIENPEKLGILIEENVEKPSNINDKIHIESFDSKSFKKRYFDILNWFKTSKSFIRSDIINQAEINHKLRI